MNDTRFQRVVVAVVLRSTHADGKSDPMRSEDGNDRAAKGWNDELARFDRQRLERNAWIRAASIPAPQVRKIQQRLLTKMTESLAFNPLPITSTRISWMPGHDGSYRRRVLCQTLDLGGRLNPIFEF